MMLAFLGLFLWFSIVDCSPQAHSHEVPQYDALIEIFEALGGPHWGNAYSKQILTKKPWQPGNNQSDYCKWAGVLCRGSPGPVVSLGLSNFNASGDFSLLGLALLKFPDLQKIDFSLNGIFGSIPSQLGQLPHLVSLNLASNKLVGQIPQNLSSLPALNTLLLAHNNFSHALPKLPPNLQNLDVEQNQLTDLTQIEWPVSLNFVNLGHNQFSGSFPEALFSAVNLLSLVMTNNTFNGTIPDLADNLTSLQVFDVSSNQFEGTVPVTFLEYPPLMVFNIARNNLTIDVLQVLLGRQSVFPPSCTLAVPFLATMDLRGNTILPIDGDMLLLQLLSLIVNTKPIMSLELDNMPVSPSSYPIGPPFYPNFEKGPRKRMYTELNFQCTETLYLGAGLTSSVFLPPSFWNYTNCECAPQYWGKPPFCQQCVRTVLCEGSTLALPGGVYPVLNHTDGSWIGSLQCISVNGTSPCLSVHLEFGELHFDEELCAPGYTGRLCRECVCEGHHEPCHFADGALCVPCQPTKTWIIVCGVIGMTFCVLAFIFVPRGSGALFIMEIAIVVLLLFLGIGQSYIFDVLVFFLIVQGLDALGGTTDEEKTRWVSIEGLAKLFLWYLQASGLLIPEEFWPSITKEILATIKIVNFRASSIDCIGFVRSISEHLGREVSKLILVCIIPFFLITMMVVTIILRHGVKLFREKYCCSDADTEEPKQMVPPTESTPMVIGGPEAHVTIINNSSDEDHPLHEEAHHEDHHANGQGHHHQPSLKIEIAQMVVFVSYATLTEVSASVFESLSCTMDPFTSKRYMTDAPAVSCDSDQYHTLQLIAWPVFVIWVIGLPLVFAFLLWINRHHLMDHDTEAWLGLLYENYSSECWWWELIWISRRVVLALAVGFFRDTAWANVLISSLLVGSICLMLIFEPLRYRTENLLEVGITALLLTTWSAGFAEENEIVNWVIVVVNLGLMAMFVIFFAYEPVKSVAKKCVTWWKDLRLWWENIRLTMED